ncbi:hypothetical protein EVAR_66658_1 [Eumeta japonica]|uniref:Uncharacterized protein n=1 Tax=Eumeta variegata TaxID=151549 RepID=A0A4C1ZAE9_EUMVA|nr:hypothetical protein EVAR_66658_1 [Eumeta japonica]
MYDPEAKQQSTVWVFQDEPNLTKWRCERACEPPKIRSSQPPMNIRNPRGSTSAVLASWIGIGYLFKRGSTDPLGRRAIRDSSRVRGGSDDPPPGRLRRPPSSTPAG